MASRPHRLNDSRIAAVRDELIIPEAPPGYAAFVATDDDITEIAAASLAAFGTSSLIRADLLRYLHKAHALIFGLRKRRALVSYCVVELNSGQRRIYVVETYTDAKLRGKGLGSWSRARVDDIALYLGYRHIASHVSVTNTPALRLNEKANMAVIRRVEGYYDDGGDAFYLRKTLAGDQSTGRTAPNRPAR